MVLVKSLRFGLLLALCNIYQENVFGDVLVRKQGFQTIETKIYDWHYCNPLYPQDRIG